MLDFKEFLAERNTVIDASLGLAQKSLSTIIDTLNGFQPIDLMVFDPKSGGYETETFGISYRVIPIPEMEKDKTRFCFQLIVDVTRSVVGKDWEAKPLGKFLVFRNTVAQEVLSSIAQAFSLATRYKA